MGRSLQACYEHGRLSSMASLIAQPPVSAAPREGKADQIRQRIERRGYGALVLETAGIQTLRRLGGGGGAGAQTPRARRPRSTNHVRGVNRGG